MSIINDALKKVQTSLDKKDAAVPLLEQKPPQATTPPPKHVPTGKAGSPAVPPPQKTLATIEQEQKEKEYQLKRQEQLLVPKRPSPLGKLLKISFFIFLFACSAFAFLYSSGYLKKISFSPKFPQIATLAKSLKKTIVSLLHKPSSSQSAGSNPIVPVAATVSSQVSSVVFPANTALSLLFVKKISPSNFVLKGIVTKNNHQMALINDGIYEEGSTIGETKVMSISSQEVKLLDGNQTITLTIEGERY